MTEEHSDECIRNDQLARDAVAELIRKAAPDGQMPTRFVLIIETINEEGQTGLWTFAPNDQRPWQTMGLLEWARAREHAWVNMVEEQEHD